MTLDRASHKRILAIDPTHRGFGYVVLEGHRLLVDWGIRDQRGAKKAGCIRAVARLIELYQPDTLILEDNSVRGSRRRERVQQLIHNLCELAKRHKVQVRRISRLMVRKTFASQGAANKHQIAHAIAAQFPELTSRLPPERKPWMSEDTRMAIFDAAAFAVVHLRLRLPRGAARVEAKRAVGPFGSKGVDGMLSLPSIR
jgi:Holliday junction resolvasome RuvABC endonuclease subunit